MLGKVTGNLKTEATYRDHVSTGRIMILLEIIASVQVFIQCLMEETCPICEKGLLRNLDKLE